MSRVSASTPLSYPPPPHHHPGPAQYSRSNYTVAPPLQPSTQGPASSAAPSQSSSTVASLAAPHQVVEFLQRIDLVQYANSFIGEGFDRIPSLMDMSEADLVAIGVKRGHRRILQRELFNMKGFPSSQPLPLAADGRPLDDNESEGSSSLNGQMMQTNANTIYVNASSGRHGHPQFATEGHTSNASGKERQELVVHTNGKRKYRRHPKPDLSAPEKPPSAYVMFSNKIRDELKDQNLAFTDMAKIVGDRWKTMSIKDKDEIESTAARAKEEYLSELAKYKTTDQFKRYQEYLSEFKEKENTASKHRRKIRTEEAPTSSAYAASATSWPERENPQRSYHQAYHRGGDSSSAGLFEHEPHHHTVSRYNASHFNANQGGYSSGYGSGAAWVPYQQTQSRKSPTNGQVNDSHDSGVGGSGSPTLKNANAIMKLHKARGLSDSSPSQNPNSSNSANPNSSNSANSSAPPLQSELQAAMPAVEKSSS